MAYQKKCYRGTPVNENVYRVDPMKKPNGSVHQSRGGGNIKPARARNPKKYATRDLKDTMPDPSPTWLAARAAKKLQVKPVKAAA